MFSRLEFRSLVKDRYDLLVRIPMTTSKEEKLVGCACSHALVALTELYYGSTSIDCGGRKNYSDSGNKIRWVTDANYIHLGRTEDNGKKTLPPYLQTVRYFPVPLNKSCYQLPVTPNATYLVRLWFVYANYNRKLKFPLFSVSLETRGMLFVFYTDPKQQLWSEQILAGSSDVLSICFIRTPDNDDPFISSIELRRLSPGMYPQVKPGTMLNVILRSDTGYSPTLEKIIRYPQDPFDRLWESDKLVNAVKSRSGNQTSATFNASSNVMISTQNTTNHPPIAVMETAKIAGRQERLDLYVKNPTDGQIPLLIILYFAEIETSNVSESRIFDVLINGHQAIPSLDITHAGVLSNRTRSSIQKEIMSNDSNIDVALRKTSNSTIGPIVNALEQYLVIPTDTETSPTDVQALSAVKRRFELKDWISDPCYQIPWNGIICSDDDSSSVIRVLEINLSGRKLTGKIPLEFGQLTELKKMLNSYPPENYRLLENNELMGGLPDLSNLTNLQILRLQNNNLSGELPNWLTHLKHLKELSLENNNFSGVIPTKLFRPSLNFRIHLYLMNCSIGIPKVKVTIYSGNDYLYNSTIMSSSNHGKVRLVVGLTIGGVLIIAIAIILFIIIVYRKKIRKEEERNKDVNAGECKYLEEHDYSSVTVPNPTKSRAFTPEEMSTATQNFSQKIGQGGFGSVFFGKLEDGREVGVKVLSMFSKQGVREFLNELDLLSRIHHKNLVSLFGYCSESRQLMLVYEYMPGGSLKDHLYGPAADISKLDWKTRLKIVLDAAQGMEYLHVGCTPKIIHRDVKSANILLDKNMTGKLADFGLSKMTIDEGDSHVTTTVKGTAGYLDPEYFTTQMLTEKSDVYSFGVVLLEIICGRQPINVKSPEEEINLLRWVTPYMETDELDPDELAKIIDKRLHSDYDIKSVSQMAKLAIRCVGTDPASRPTISEIITEIREALALHSISAPTRISEEIEIKFEDLHTSTGAMSIEDSSGPKDIDSGGSSYNVPPEER
eukprot:Gb_37625 [translate_table: standard]